MLDGFDEIHIVPGSSDAMRTEWDKARRKVVVYTHPASREDRQLQRWWIRQDSIPERFIYPDQAPQTFLEAGGSRIRLVENAELCGFIAGVFDCASWGVDVDKAISCFFNITNDGWKKPEPYKQILEGCHGTGISLAMDTLALWWRLD
ncbi:hypothetical protein BFJ71_g2251 [Fusarium oxysporum]|nr:hypothetical protein BFJ71_g2251 [Fusarium oxysporum]